MGHRVVHGGEKFAQSVRHRPTRSMMAALEECIPLAPLHNPANITGIKRLRQVMGPGRAHGAPCSTPPSIRPCPPKSLHLRPALRVL
ncbi:MAG: hypothetical protein ACLT3D_00405 [Lawsonibacter sp.]